MIDPIQEIRLAALRRFCESTAEMLDDFVIEMRAKEHLGVAFSAIYLKDSLEVFVKTCERRIRAGGDI